MSGLVVGVGACRGVGHDEVSTLVAEVLAAAGVAPDRVAALATVDVRGREPALLAAAAELGVPLRCRPAAELAEVDVPHPSGMARERLGTPSVAEAAALLGAGPGARLLVPKRRSSPPDGRPAMATCALAGPAEPGRAR
ncbi:cobalamin biosynthesis protein [Streptomyces alkaliterrae]|uniref:Cobalamin biosynthesis protein n=1 Tax=Streptomyces alkaliterrae TaxID=2213162 RepID=A0A5P0YJ48_9ACTN|nr:cobalamin biosynthesis protein [Streptomyces alkaliterrae]MBB1252040.1 cobalamin biosynthesis protein [Streptomyces alkaliterrae]MBB1261049.1 cobalamin biosynthesis protein [Streptomyces alkaliterrae]MQS00404.1 cobyrinic acid a,c-diamide synthase [Streptomyces alkaliterrae]